MKRIVIAVILASIPLHGASSQNSGARIGACAVMPHELVEKHAENPAALKYMKPREEPVDAIGSSCEYGSLGLQVNPFGATSRPKAPSPEWTAVNGLGDAAFFRPNRKYYAELIVWSGPNHITIQYGVPRGSTPEAEKPTTIAFATAVLAKLR